MKNTIMEKRKIKEINVHTADYSNYGEQGLHVLHVTGHVYEHECEHVTGHVEHVLGHVLVHV